MIGQQASATLAVQHDVIAEADAPMRLAGHGAVTALTKRLSSVGWPGAFAFCFGLAITIGGSVWAVQQEVSHAITVMAAYSTVAANLALVAAMPAFRKPAVIEMRAPAVAGNEPNYAAWRLVSTLNIADASRLWCAIEPGHPSSQESIAWATAMLDAIKTGELPITARQNATPEATEREKTNPTWHTKVTRAALEKWAKAHGHCPTFLQA